jgi:tetratricopeptide (TPR) repeat protein
VDEAVWKIHLLGPPRAVQGAEEKRPELQKTWALLAYLLLPPLVSLHGVPTAPSAFSRADIGVLFWPDSMDSRTVLRQSLRLLRQTFQETTGPRAKAGSEQDCFLSTRHTVQAKPGFFVTDIEQLTIDYWKALHAKTLEERLFWLFEAEREIGGAFLEGCAQLEGAGARWVRRRRKELSEKAAEIRWAAVETLTELGRLPAALEMACRLLEASPDHVEARKKAQELARRTGRKVVFEALRKEEGLQSVIDRLRPKPLQDVTLKERETFDFLFKPEYQTLPATLQEDFLRLSIFPSPFTAEMAKAVCDVSGVALLKLAETPLLDRRDDAFSFPEIVRDGAWRMAPPGLQRRQRRRLLRYCNGWMKATVDDYGTPGRTAPPFRDLLHAKPFIAAALEGLFDELPTRKRLEFLSRICRKGREELSDLALRAVPYFERAYLDATLPPADRCFAAWNAGQILLGHSESARAAVFFQRVLDLHTQGLGFGWPNPGDTYFDLGMALHYGGDSLRAIPFIEEAERFYDQRNDVQKRAACWRFMAEIQSALGDYEAALRLSDAALSLRLLEGPRWTNVADALFWKGDSLFHLGRLEEAGDCIEEALSIWRECGADAGVGHCLRLLGRLRCAEGRFAEAGSHLDHAILIHDRLGDSGSRIAAVVAKGDTWLASGIFGEARSCYRDALAYYEAKALSNAAEGLRAKLAALAASGDTDF